MKDVQESSTRDDPKTIETRAGNGQLLLIVILVLMLFMGPVVLLKQVYPNGSWRILPVVIALVAAEGTWTTRWLRHAPRGLNRRIYRLAEVISIALIITFFFWLTLSNSLRDQMVRNFLEEPLSILDFRLMVFLILCLLAWEWSNQLTGILSRLAMSEEEITFYTTPSLERQEKGMAMVVPVYRNQLFHSYIRHWAIGGLILAIFAMLATVELTGTNLAAVQTLNIRAVTRLGLPPDMLLALVIYFGAGFWLASHARLAVMQARWVAGGIEIDSSLRSKWRWQVIIIILCVGVLAAFLPIGSTFAISEIMQALLGYIIVALTFVIGLIPFLLAWILSLISLGTQTSEPLQAEDLPPINPGIENSEAILNISPAIFEGLFIVTTIIIILIALIYFLKYRSFNIEWTWLARFWSRLFYHLRTAWLRFSRRSGYLVDAIQSRMKKTTQNDREDVGPWRFPSLPDNSPRGRVRYYYLSLLDRAAKQGVSRGSGETPLELEKKLIGGWPGVEDEISYLTRLFLMARYSRLPLTVQTSHEAKGIFQRLRKAIRKPARPESFSQSSSPDLPESSDPV